MMNSELVTHLSIGSYPINLTESYYLALSSATAPYPPYLLRPCTLLAYLFNSPHCCILLVQPPNFLLWHPCPHFLPLSPLSYHSIDLQQILTLSVLKKCMFPETCVCAELISHFLMENLSTCSSLSFSRLLNWVSETI